MLTFILSFKNVTLGVTLCAGNYARFTEEIIDQGSAFAQAKALHNTGPLGY